MALEHEKNEGDTLVESEGLRILFDEDTASILDGATIDFLEGLERSGFTITNPNYQGGGCGGGYGGGYGGSGYGTCIPGYGWQGQEQNDSNFYWNISIGGRTSW